MNDTEHKSAKYGLWGAVLGAIITGVVTLYIHYDGGTEIEKKQEQEKKADQNKDTANLTISDIYLPPINTSIDSSFFVEVSNKSLNVAKELKVKLDFGEATVTKCETLPVNVFADVKSYQNSILTFSMGDLVRNDSFYVYCLISQPTFKSLLITGKNLFSNEYVTYESYHPNIKNDESGFVTFFKVIASMVAVVFITYFVVTSLILINRRLKL